MMTFDQIMESYAAYIRTREVSDDIEWFERKEEETENERSTEGKDGGSQQNA